MLHRLFPYIERQYCNTISLKTDFDNESIKRISDNYFPRYISLINKNNLILITYLINFILYTLSV